eukprot:15913719-Heterocapsa_arctica.AAC.1
MERLVRSEAPRAELRDGGGHQPVGMGVHADSFGQVGLDRLRLRVPRADGLLLAHVVPSAICAPIYISV